MPDYGKYRAALKLSNNDIISAVQQKHPGFTKIQCAMINNPNRYGVQLTAEAERLVADKFGYADGLSVKPKKKREVKRAKTKRLSVRLDDASYDRVKNKMQQEGSESVQSFLEKLLKEATKEERTDDGII